MIAFPLIYAGMLALAFGGDSGPPKASILVMNADQDLVGGLLLTLATSDQSAEYFKVTEVETEAEGRQRMEKGDASALLIIPEGLSDAVFNGQSATFQMVRNPAQSILPEVAEQATRVLVDGLSSVSRLLSQTMNDLPVDSLSDLEDIRNLDDAGVVLLTRVFDRRLRTAAEEIMDPSLSLEVTQKGEEEPSDAGDSLVQAIFLLMLPGVSVYALFLIGDIVMRDVLQESTMGTLQRIASAPVSLRQVILAKGVVTFCIAGFALLSLAIIATLVMENPVHVGAFLALAAALLVAVTGFAAAIYGLTSSERQGATVAGAVYLFMAFLGGSFIPVSQLPASLQRIAPASIFFWGTDGFRALLEDSAGIRELIPHLAVLLGVGGLLVVVGSTLLSRRLEKGL